MRPAIIGTAATAALLLSSCGQAKLAPDDAYRVAVAEQSFAHTVLDGSSYGQTLRSVDYLIRLCRRDPDALYEKRTVKQVVEDSANELRDYQHELAADLDRVLDDGCR